MPDHSFHGVKVGPVIVGKTVEKRPKTQADRHNGLICWGFTVLLIAWNAPFLGVILVLLTAIYLAARTAPSNHDERNAP